MIQMQPGNDASLLAAERAVGELRRQQGIGLRLPAGSACLYPAEFVTEEQWESWKDRAPKLVVTPARAQSLGLACDGKAVCLDIAGLPLPGLLALADPLLPPPSSLPPSRPALPMQAQALALAKHAALLPALLWIEMPPPEGWLSLDGAALADYLSRSQIELIETAQARLPIAAEENTRIIGFRSRFAPNVHLALVVGDALSQESPLVRVHSSCVTGDILGSLRCDCGSQLQLSLLRMAEAGGGILLYLHQEGRGIGITNKLRAYALQERGFDTYEANRLLGFDEDERDFAIAAAMLRHLGVGRLRLLTNNPAKLAQLAACGVEITGREALTVAPGRHNHDYLGAKAGKAGHLL